MQDIIYLRHSRLTVDVQEFSQINFPFMEWAASEGFTGECNPFENQEYLFVRKNQKYKSCSLTSCLILGRFEMIKS